ncbi:MAG: glycoside hydrolase family 2 [Bacteroidales bacterium]|nr:glycoside hydrolase family 2 [Bacteroidales bacterium]
MKKIWILLLAVTSAACAKNAPSGERVRLDANWTLARTGGSECVNTTVPSTVAGALCEAGILPENLLEGRNYEKADKAIFDDEWVYRTTFKTKKGPRQHCELVFDGLDYYADIFLNGRQIASSDTTVGMFIRRAFDITRLVRRNNTLEVKLRRAQDGDLNHGFVDWNPRPLDQTMGIVRPVTLHTTGAVSVEDVFVIPDLDVETFATADLTVRATLCNKEDRPVEAKLLLDLQEAGVSMVSFDLGAGETKEVTVTPAEAECLHIDKPRVWWTWDLGTPELYDLKVWAEVDGTLSDEENVTFGIRKIESRLTEDNHRQFTLNGKDILLKGAGWTDDIFLRDTPESIGRQVRYVKDMNLNLIRFENIWGKDDTVYDLCDRLGVLALVGFSCQWEWENYCGLPEVGHFGCINGREVEDLAVRYFHDQVVRLHNHPAVIAWLTGSDRIPNPGLEERYLAIFEKEDYRPYVCSAKNMESLAGWSGAKMEGPYEYVGADYWYKDTKAGGAFGWNTETGIGANLPQLESLKKMIPEESLWPLSDVWDYHCTTSSSAMNSTKVLQETIRGLYGGFDGLEDFVRKAHAVDYDGTRAMFEAFRVRIPKSTGIVQWMLNSAWPSLYWQLYDWYGVPTAGYYGTKKACEPVQLLFDYATRKVYVVNELLEPRTLTATLKVYDAASGLIGQETKPVTVGYRDVVPVFDLKRFDGKPHFVALALSDGETPVADNFYCLPAKDNEYNWKKTNWYVTPITAYADLGFAFAQPEAEVEMTVEGNSVTLENKSGVIAYLNILKAKDAEGNLVVPACWSDNFFPLLPGERKTVTCTVEAENVHFELDKQ